MDNCESNAGQLDEITREPEVEEEASSTMGQSESKKNGKHILVAGPPNTTRTGGGIASKGSMSFGFKKGTKATNSNATLQRSQDKAANKKEYAKLQQQSDSNGNSDSVDTKVTASRLVAPRKEQSGQSYRSNRFGFRHANIVRPTSTGLQPKVSEDFEEDLNNNHTTDVKEPRSKSAMGRTDTLNNNHNTTAQTVRQKTMDDLKSTRTMLGKPPIKTPSIDSQLGKKTTTRISIKLHSHSIDTQPTVTGDGARPAAGHDPVRKFTLQTTSLPQAEYAVPVSVRTTRVELKNVKQSLNNSRREFLGLNAQNEPIAQPPQPYRGHRVNNQRNLEMVLSGNHRFEVRDLEDMESSVVVPLALPKLPSAFDASEATPLVPTGLVRQDQMRRRNQETTEPTHQARHKESVEEEKLLIDSTITEKGDQKRKEKRVELQEENMKEEEENKMMISSTTTESITMKSINTSWSIAGESMVHESQLSHKNKGEEETEEATLNAPSSLAVDSVNEEEEEPQTTTNPGDTDNEVTLNDVQLEMHDEEATLNEPYESELEQFVKNHDEPLLEDETSPSVSLLTSSGKTEEKEKEAVDEDRLEDTPEPDNMNKSPTHTSHSSSISEPGRDFLIDDEIADQPGLFSNYKNDSSAAELPKAPSSNNEKALVKSSPLAKHRSQFQIKSKLSPLFAHHHSPLMKLRQIQRTESLDTLSPCDSIASDDLMMDFESTSSFESIDRMDQTLKEDKGSIPNAVDHEMQLWHELEQQSGQLFREWKSILSTATVTSIRNTPPTPSPPPPSVPVACTQSSSASSAVVVTLPSQSNLPAARGTRLLNRSRVQSGLPSGLDSPRTVEQIPRPRRSSSLTKTPSPLQGAVTVVGKGCGGDCAVTADDLSITRSTRNAMIQDVLYFKKQLLRLRRLLQEDEDILKRTETLNPFEMTNGDISSPNDDNNNNNNNRTSRLFTTYLNMDNNTAKVGDASDSLNTNGQEQQSGQDWSEMNANPQQLNGGGGEEDANNNSNYCNAQEMMDMRRQLVYLQSQLDENARTIRIQKNLITKYETEKQHLQPAKESTKASVTVATQTERIRPVSQSRLNGISTRIEHTNGHPKTRSRSIGIPMPNRQAASANGGIKSGLGGGPVSLISGMGIYMEDNNKKAGRTNYAENLLLQNNRKNLLSTTPPNSQGTTTHGQIYSKKSSMDDLLTIKHISVSPPKFSASSPPTGTQTTRRVPISRISLKYLRPSLASSTNSLSSVNHSIASSSSSLSDHNNSKSCLKIDGNYS